MLNEQFYAGAILTFGEIGLKENFKFSDKISDRVYDYETLKNIFIMNMGKYGKQYFSTLDVRWFTLRKIELLNLYGRGINEFNPLEQEEVARLEMEGYIKKEGESYSILPIGRFYLFRVSNYKQYIEFLNKALALGFTKDDVDSYLINHTSEDLFDIEKFKNSFNANNEQKR